MSNAAQQAHIFPHFPAGALISIGQLCNVGYTAEFDTTTLCIRLQGRPVLTGIDSPVTKLWFIDSSPATPSPTAAPYSYTTQNLAVRSPAFRTTPYSTIINRIAFLHGALGNPVMSMLCKVLDAYHLTSWPEITSNLDQKYPPNRPRCYKATLIKCAETLGQRKTLRQLPDHLQHL